MHSVGGWVFVVDVTRRLGTLLHSLDFFFPLPLLDFCFHHSIDAKGIFTFLFDDYESVCAGSQYVGIYIFLVYYYCKKQYVPSLI